MTNFWQALEQADLTVVEPKREYRLYYDPKSGEPLFYTMQEEDGAYLEIDEAAYLAQRMDIYIADGKIHTVKHERLGKLVPSDSGTATHPNDIAVVMDSDTYWTQRTYEHD